MSRSPGLGLFLFILLNATLFLRPSELAPGLGELPLYNIIIVACLIVSLPFIARQLTRDSLRRSPLSACALCLLGSVVLADMLRGRIGFAIEAVTELAKVLAYYFLLVGVLDSFARIRKFLLWTCYLVVVLVSLALLHYYQVIHIPALEAYHELQWEDVGEDGDQPMLLARLQATGIYGNPNDLARILVVGLLCSLYFVGDRRVGGRRMFWLVPIALFGHGLHLTHSRGGLLALLAGIGALAYARYGSAKMVLLGGGVMVLVLVILGGRQANMSTTEGTGQQRVKIWNEGFVVMQSSPIFGAGMNQYRKEVGIVAHNSFVHCYVELGLVGGTFFFGLFYLPIRALWTPALSQLRDVDAELSQFRPYMLAVLVATVVGMLSSSRSYSIPTYLVVGMATAFCNILAERGVVLLPAFGWTLFKQLVKPSGVAVATLFLYAKFMARY
jgi:putative inorganic carbon (hco3(-)) transporter